MSNEVLHSEISNLDRKVKLLLNEHVLLKKEIDSLRQKNSLLESKVSEKEATLSGFQNQMKISKIVESMVAGDENTSELKEVIDGYIKEIDKCIAHLSEAK
jgi:regulator of replication initiation timing